MEEWKKKLEDSAREIEIPERLRPDQVEQWLNAADHEKETAKTARGSKWRLSFRRPGVWALAAAAVLVMTVGIHALSGSFPYFSSKSAESTADSSLSGAGQTAEAGAYEEEGAEETAEEAALEKAETVEEGEPADAAVMSGSAFGQDTGSALGMEDGKKTDSLNQAAAEEEEFDPDDIVTADIFFEFYHTVTYEELKQIMAGVARPGPVYRPMEEYGATTQGNNIADGNAVAEGSSVYFGAEDAGEDTGIQTEYSSTNRIVSDVDEGDIVKTDGTYLYMLSSSDGKVRIVDAKAMKVVSVISPVSVGTNTVFQEMYIDQDRLVLVCSAYGSQLEKKEQGYIQLKNKNKTILLTYDLSNIQKPELAGSVEQDGYYYTSRKVGNYIYLFSNYYGDAAYMTGQIPSVNGQLVPEGSIYVPDEVDQCRYLVMSSTDIRQPDRTVDQKALVSDTEQFYVSKTGIYIIQGEGRMEDGVWNRFSDVIQFRMGKGKIKASSAVSLKGELQDLFAVDEYNGYLRILLTDWNNPSGASQNLVYVLDSTMNICGKIENVAPGESIYSARFMGEIGYFVTYRNVDPLFSVDFSDPANPKVIGELKVTGFSDYLHFYGATKLLGIGWETDPESGAQLGLKLSMYDIQDPGQVKEEQKLVISNVDICPATDEYKTVLIDPEKNLIGFVLGNYGELMNIKYVVFSYDEEQGFEKQMEFDLSGNAYSVPEKVRGLYIGDDLYVAEEHRITRFDRKNQFAETASLELDRE